MKRKKCYIYMRVSTAMQVDGYSLEAQKDRLTKFAEFQKMDIVREYCDAGKSGKNITGRPEFSQMLRDVADDRDGVDYILVFKLSRFGRNAADVLNSLQYIQDFGVNLICVEDGIDSSKDSGKLTITVLSAVAEIERENILVQTMEGRKQKAREGKWNGGLAPFGYRLDSKTSTLMVEPEEAAVVKEIFDMKIAGTGTTLIVKVLNDRGIPCPSELYRSRGDTRQWKNRGKPCYWTAGKIEAIIRDEKYTGTMVQLKTKLDSVGGKQVSRPKEEWVRVENTHEPVIAYSQYIRAVSSLKQQKAAESRKMKNIYYCGCCGRALFNAHYGTIFCKQRSFKTDSDCRDIEINKHDADMAVLASVKREADIFLDRDKLSRQVIKRNSPLSVSDRINATMRSIEAAQKSWIALYDKYADGKLEREFFLNEKKQYDADMEKMEEELAALRQAQEEEKTEQQGSERKADQAMAFLEEEELTEDMKEKLIEKVIVYPGDRIEIVWKFEGHLNN